MSFDSLAFRRSYVAAGGTANSARSYVAYLNRVDRVADGLTERLTSLGSEGFLDWLERQPPAAFGGRPHLRNSISAARKFVRLSEFGCRADAQTRHENTPVPSPSSPASSDEVRQLLADAQELGARYYSIMGRPLGVTGEVAELAAADLLGVELAGAREAGFDAWIEREGRTLRVQIKGRAVDPARRYVGRCPAIKAGGLFDLCLLVLLDRSTMEPLEIWEAREEDILKKLRHPGSRSRNERNSLAIAQFKGAGRSGAAAAKKVWSSREN